MTERISDHEAPEWVTQCVVITDAGCWEWTATRLKRYGNHGGDRAVVSSGPHHGRSAQRVMWEEVRGPLPRTIVIRHECDNGMCMRPTHILTGTHRQNTQDARNRGRLRPGGLPFVA